MDITDAIIPFHIKDAPILHNTCHSLKNELNIKNIFIVGNENPNIKDTIFVNENSIKNLLSLNEIKHIWKSKNENISYRAGWIYQQFLKLAASDYISDISNNFLICDADIIFVNNPYKNFTEDFFPYSVAYTNEYHTPYRDQYFRLLREKTSSGFSFINHQMMFCKKYLDELKKHIENTHNMRWDLAIMETLDYSEASNFSEYDLYGNWMYKYFFDKLQKIEMRIIDVHHSPSSEELTYFKNQGMHIVSSQAYKRIS